MQKFAFTDIAIKNIVIKITINAYHIINHDAIGSKN